MKKLFILASAALVLAACNNDVKIDENTAPVGSNVQKEIAFTSYAQGPKHVKSNAPIEGATFTPTTMVVAAYDATADANFFDATTFTKDNGTGTWKGGKYWPLTEATINFLAYAEFEAGTATWHATNPAREVALAMANNSIAQKDLMYACGTGTVTQSTNVLTFPDNVPMEFKHAQALIKFAVKAGNSTSASAITINSITLNSVSCQGTFTVTHANWDEDKAARDADAGKNGSVSGVWSDYSTYAGNIEVVEDGGFALSTDLDDFGSLMVVPAQGMASFTINYSVDGNDYDYTYTPASTTLAQATKYTYNIKLTLHEIEIAPTVEEWTEYGTEYIEIPALTYGENRSVSVSKNAQKLVYTISGLAGDKKIKVTKDGAGAAQVTSTDPALNSVVAESATAQKITINLAANADSDKAMTVTIQEYESDGTTPAGSPSVITITQTH